MEKALLKRFLEYEFYKENKYHIIRELFSHDLYSIYTTISKAHETYKTDLDIEWVRRLHRDYNPALTTANLNNIAILLDDIAHESVVPDNIAADMLGSMYLREKSRQIAKAALDVTNGHVDNLNEVCKLVEQYSNDDPINLGDNYEEIKFDLDNLLKETSTDGLFPFRFKPLSDKIPGAGRGNFIIVFARPNVGKTTWMCFEASGYLQQKLTVAYFGNEEPANRVYVRLLCSFFEKSVDELSLDVEKYKKEFEAYKDKLHMIDCVGMSIEQVDAWVSKHKPDVVILDQLDKFNIAGTYNRSDEKLGAAYGYAREIAKRNKCLVYGVSQCSAEGEGLQTITPDMLRGSKTDKQGEADLIIGIGRNPMLNGKQDYRQLNIGKNKINGCHECVGATINELNATYEA